MYVILIARVMPQETAPLAIVTIGIPAPGGENTGEMMIKDLIIFG